MDSIFFGKLYCNSRDREILQIVPKFGRFSAKSGDLEEKSSNLLSQKNAFHPAVQMHVTPRPLTFDLQVAPFLQGVSEHT